MNEFLYKQDGFIGAFRFEWIAIVIFVLLTVSGIKFYNNYKKIEQERIEALIEQERLKEELRVSEELAKINADALAKQIEEEKKMEKAVKESIQEGTDDYFAQDRVEITPLQHEIVTDNLNQLSTEKPSVAKPRGANSVIKPIAKATIKPLSSKPSDAKLKSLANGMLRSYCSAVSDQSRCTL